jgi:hypothetical protein
MRRTALRTRKVPGAPAQLATVVPPDHLADSFDDYISEDLVDYDDEREAMDVVVRGSLDSVN